ncbi:MAG: hypothetical protein JXB49_11400 [Bacteroidales bacterium]|nr:hypothetical protein [Bacteroidales bacterium]
MNIMIYSQREHPFSLQTGAGYYEGFHAGLQYSYFSRHITSASLGFDKNVFSTGTLVTFTLEHDYGWIHKNSNPEEFSWTLQGKASIWYLEDEYYKWHVLSLSLTLNRNIILGPKVYLSIDAGPLFNIVLANHRKTFEEVGWPNSVRPNVRILVHYRL